MHVESFGSFSSVARAYMYALCVSGAVNTQGFVWKFFMRMIYKFSFIHSSNDRGNILQISCKTSLEKNDSVSLCSANAWIGTHATFPVIPKRCCRFSVVQSFQFEFAIHLTYIQGKHSRSIDRKYNYREC